jgi:uncharacterized membrane protein
VSGKRFEEEIVEMATIEERLTAAGQDVSELTGGDVTGGGVTPNVGQVERWASAIGGGALALFGITRGSLGGIALALVGAALVQRGVSGHCNLYEAMNFSTAGGEALRNSENVSVPAERGTKVEKSVEINRPAAVLYDFWRNFENLPRIMNHLESVTTTGDRSHWVAKGPAGSKVEWDAEIYNEKQGELIAWRTLEGSQVASAGSVRFEETMPGTTTVSVSLKYDPPGGKLGSAVAYLFGENPSQQIADDLQRFKQMMESRESSDAGGQQRGASAGK